MTQNLFADVREFSTIGGSPDYLTNPRVTLDLCEKLVTEEVVNEFLPALQKYRNNPSLENLAEAADGAIDGIYVLVFFLNQMGLPGQKLWDIVQSANMAKFPNGVAVRNEFGKVQKPADWKAPDFMPTLIEWYSAQRGESYKGGMIYHSFLGGFTKGEEA